MRRKHPGMSAEGKECGDGCQCRNCGSLPSFFSLPASIICLLIFLSNSCCAKFVISITHHGIEACTAGASQPRISRSASVSPGMMIGWKNSVWPVEGAWTSVQDRIIDQLIQAWLLFMGATLSLSVPRAGSVTLFHTKRS